MSGPDFSEITKDEPEKSLTIALKKTGGWADKTIPEYLDERETVKVCAVKSPEEAVEKAMEFSNIHIYG